MAWQTSYLTLSSQLVVVINSLQFSVDLGIALRQSMMEVISSASSYDTVLGKTLDDSTTADIRSTSYGVEAGTGFGGSWALVKSLNKCAGGWMSSAYSNRFTKPLIPRNLVVLKLTLKNNRHFIAPVAKNSAVCHFILDI